MQALEDGLSALLEFLPKLLGFLLILVIGYVVAKLIAKIIAKVLQKVGFDRAVEKGGPPPPPVRPYVQDTPPPPYGQEQQGYDQRAESVPGGLAAGILTYREGAVQFTLV